MTFGKRDEKSPSIRTHQQAKEKIEMKNECVPYYTKDAFKMKKKKKKKNGGYWTLLVDPR